MRYVTLVIVALTAFGCDSQDPNELSGVWTGNHANVALWGGETDSYRVTLDTKGGKINGSAKVVFKMKDETKSFEDTYQVVGRDSSSTLILQFWREDLGDPFLTVRGQRQGEMIAGEVTYGTWCLGCGRFPKPQLELHRR